MTIWRKVRHNGDDCYAYCGRIDDRGNYSEMCSSYCDDELCKNCKYIIGKVIEEEREEE